MAALAVGGLAFAVVATAGILAATAAFALLATTALAPPPLPTPAEEFQAYLDANAQTVRVSSTVAIGAG